MEVVIGRTEKGGARGADSWTSTFPNVTETKRTSISSGLAENARRRARTSSVPW